jgi:hypothetical protein
MFKIILCLYGALAKIQALLLAKRLPVGWGKQMCLNVRLALYFCRSFCSLSLSFLALAVTARRYNLVGVSRRSIRARSWYFSQKCVPVQGGYGALFAVEAQILLSITRVAVQV